MFIIFLKAPSPGISAFNGTGSDLSITSVTEHYSAKLVMIQIIPLPNRVGAPVIATVATSKL